MTIAHLKSFPSKIAASANTIAISFLPGLLITGCARLSAGRLEDVAPPKAVNVCLVRGYLDWYSAGIDELTTQLLSDGVQAEAFREEQWGDLADVLSQHPQRPMFLIGFSYGADDVILIARELNEKHIPVDLLITIDPVTPALVPANVKRCVNFYEPNGFWDFFPWLRGVQVEGGPGERVENINVRARADLNEPGTSHATIAANEKVHREIVTLVRDAR